MRVPRAGQQGCHPDGGSCADHHLEQRWLRDDGREAVDDGWLKICHVASRQLPVGRCASMRCRVYWGSASAKEWAAPADHNHCWARA